MPLTICHLKATQNTASPPFPNTAASQLAHHSQAHQSDVHLPTRSIADSTPSTHLHADIASKNYSQSSPTRSAPKEVPSSDALDPLTRSPQDILEDEDILVEDDILEPMRDLSVHHPYQKYRPSHQSLQRMTGTTDNLVSGRQIEVEEDDEEDDGEMLARLLRRAEQMRKKEEDPVSAQDPAYHQVNVRPNTVEGCASCGLVEDNQEEDRRQKAIDFLENLVINLFRSIHGNLQRLNNKEIEQHQKRTKSIKKPSSKRDGAQVIGKRKKSPTEDEDEEHERQTGSGDGPLKTPGRRVSTSKSTSQASSQESDKSQDGIVLVTKNRKTGGDHVIKFPEDPVTYMQAGEQGPTALDRMARVFRVASLLHEAILTDTPTTKRDIYYKDVRLFKDQRSVDKIVDDLAATAGLKRADFCVCATSKGLVASAVLRLFLKTGEELSMSATLAALIHPIERIGRIETTEPLSWVLVVEKDAVFTTLLAAKLLSDDRIGHGIFITGKGYPDLATLQLVSRLADIYPEATVHGLFDADPHGIDILSNYTFGSQASRFSKDHIGLDLGNRLTWMGVKASEWSDTGIGYDDLLPLSDRDVSKAMKMLRDRPNMPQAWKRELCHMLHLNRKAEIEVIQSSQRENVGGQRGDEHGFQQDVEGNKLVEYVVRRLQQ